jgi:hypothetical protein
MLTIVRYKKPRVMMLACEKSTAGQAVETRTRITTRNKNSLAGKAGSIRPLDRDPVSRILAGKA